MNVLCNLFGHRAPIYGANKGWGGGEYCKLSLGTVDGIGRVHCGVHGDCPRCGKTYLVARTYLPRIPA